MPSAAHILGASFLIDSLIGLNPRQQTNIFQDVEILIENRQSEEVLEGTASSQSTLKTGGTEYNIPEIKLYITEAEPSKGKARGTITKKPEDGLDVHESRKSEIAQQAIGNVQSNDKLIYSEYNQLKESPGSHKIINGDILCIKASEKPNQSYMALISRAILSSPEKRLQLSEIYQWIMENYPYYHNQEKSWRNSVRHNLSLNECFIKAGRSDNGKGHYWAVHPTNLEAFSRGDYQRRRARRRIRRNSSALAYQPQFPVCTLCCFHQQLCICCPLLHPSSSHIQVCPLVKHPFTMPLLWPWHQVPPYL
ncbi:uncharacterized protein RCH25_037236 [Pelodytes ibericus]